MVRKVIKTIRNKYNDSPMVEERYVNVEWILERLEKINGPSSDDYMIQVDQLIQEIKEK